MNQRRIVTVFLLTSGILLGRAAPPSKDDAVRRLAEEVRDQGWEPHWTAADIRIKP